MPEKQDCSDSPAKAVAEMRLRLSINKLWNEA